MIARLILAVLAVGLAAAQQEFILYTNGTGGVDCGKYHRCITNATCGKKDGLDMCECIPELTGNAKIQCLPHEDHNVWIQNDPHIKNFHKEFASLLTPCPYRVFNLVFLIEEKDVRAEVLLYGSNLLFQGGEYYLERMTLSSTVYMGDDVMKQVMTFYGDVLDDDGYSYKLVAKSLETDINSGVGGGAVSIEEGPFVDYAMDVEKDDDNNLLKVMIKSLGITLLFRPPSLKDMMDNKLLPMVPGAVLNVDKEHWKFVVFNQSDYDIASWPQGPSLEDKATELNIPKPLLVQYLMLKNSVNIYRNDSICSESSRIFKEVCDTEDIKVDMLRTCSSLFTEKDFLVCLTDKNSMEDYVPMQKEMFQKCELCMCQRNTTECEAMKKEIAVVTKCPPPQKIQELDCGDRTFLNIVGRPVINVYQQEEIGAY